jgi:hypothetical protein
MNSALTFRLPALAVSAEGGQTSMAPAASIAVNSETLDETLIIQICEGSREALAILFRRYARLVRGVCFRVLRLCFAKKAYALSLAGFGLVHCCLVVLSSQ